MRVALVHDWLTGMRGGEKVLEILCELHPGADLFTLFHVPGSVSPVIEDRRIRESFLARLPGIERYYRRLLPTFPFMIERFDLRGYDLVHRKRLLVSVHELHLAGGGCGLQVFEFRAPHVDAEHAAADRNCPR